MQADLEKAFNRAAELDSLTPVRAYLAHWSAVVEIERFPDTARQYHRSLYLAHRAESPEEVREHLTVSSEILRPSTQAVPRGRPTAEGPSTITGLPTPP
ncbi:hypothetical protein LN042_35455 [Kitasatospora sp. RB6PN24]|uniref:hypothetical protein n=1 Tax=Kitasatospora humi TaxID=2893891 RepID=UPI001E61858A|nr:hypothetical protein [Kitasatospora humi]MCC9312300.1 hypothetical protein [Kitasatospora humi]